LEYKLNFYKQLETKNPSVIPVVSAKKTKKLVQIKYKTPDLPERVSLTISDQDRKDFLK